MRRLLTAIVLFYFGSILLYGQIYNSKDSLTHFSYSCYNDTISILMPADYNGPKYFCHEEGSIVSFIGNDFSIVHILCAGNTVLTVDSTYLSTDKIQKDNGDYYIYYYSKSKDRFACICHINRRTYMYSDAPLKRKKQLDKAFEIIEKNKNGH